MVVGARNFTMVTTQYLHITQAEYEGYQIIGIAVFANKSICAVIYNLVPIPNRIILIQVWSINISILRLITITVRSINSYVIKGHKQIQGLLKVKSEVLIVGY